MATPKLDTWSLAHSIRTANIFGSTVSTDAPPVNFETKYWGNPSLGSTHNFKVTWDSTDNHLHLFLDDSTVPCNGGGACSETPWNPRSVWGGSSGQIYGETQHKNDDILGYSGSHETFSSVQEQSYSDLGTWHSYSLTGQNSWCFYNRQQDGSTPNQKFDIWTDPVDHTGC
jgi:hypothetical protein